MPLIRAIRSRARWGVNDDVQIWFFADPKAQIVEVSMGFSVTINEAEF